MTAPVLAPPVRRYRSGGWGVDFGDAFPMWCPDLTAVNEELLARGFDAVTALPADEAPETQAT